MRGMECGGAASWLTNTGKHWTKLSKPRRDGVPLSGDVYSGDREEKHQSWIRNLISPKSFPRFNCREQVI